MLRLRLQAFAQVLGHAHGDLDLLHDDLLHDDLLHDGIHSRGAVPANVRRNGPETSPRRFPERLHFAKRGESKWLKDLANASSGRIPISAARCRGRILRASPAAARNSSVT